MLLEKNKDNELDSDILLNEIESSRQYLQENFGKENITEEESLEVVKEIMENDNVL